jgi:energy-coupling factor transporter transmembrane protein EcfT
MNAGGSVVTGPEDRLVLRSSTRKAAFLLITALVFVGLGILLGTGTMGFSGWIAMPARIVGWFAVPFFGLGVPLALFQLLTNRSYLLLTRDGFQMFGIRKSRLIPWSEVAAFTAYIPPTLVFAWLPKRIRDLGPKMVLFDYRPDVEAFRRMRAVNQTLTGHDAGLADTYGLKAEELATLMNGWRSRFTKS